MNWSTDSLGSSRIGDELYAFVSAIFPICRSITGNGVRQTLSAVSHHIDLAIHEVPTGTQVFDWTVPREWNVTDAYIKTESGVKIVDFKKSNLHVMSYSIPVRKRMQLDELKFHVFTLPDQRELIPYRTSYYSENWAFCMAHSQLEALRDETFEVLIDSTLVDGHLTYGEFLHKGESDDEFLFSVHVCHPSLANDNCSGIALVTYLAKHLSRLKTRFSYRFLFVPGTIGAITWLARNEDRLGKIRHGLVVSMVGDGGGPTYKKTRRGNADIDQAMLHVLRHSDPSPGTILDFSPYGYDERQYCSPGFDLPVGLFQRSKFGSIPEYHTSADNLEFVRPDHLAQSYQLIANTIDVIEHNTVFLNTLPKCEPQLGRRGLYGAIGGDKNAADANMAMLWILNLSDGKYSLLDIAERSGLPFELVQRTAQTLRNHQLLEPAMFA